MRSEKGQSLIELIVAMFVLSVVLGGMLTAIHITYRTTREVNQRTVAESVARAQLEYIKTCAYDADNNPPTYSLDPDLDLTASPYSGDYNVDVSAVRLDPSQDGTDDDEGIQQVTVTVVGSSGATVAVSEYKVNR